MLKQYWLDGILWEWDTEKGKWANLAEDGKKQHWEDWERAYRLKHKTSPDIGKMKEITALFTEYIKIKNSEPNAKDVYSACMKVLEHDGFEAWYEKTLIDSPNIAARVSSMAAEAGKDWGNALDWYLFTERSMGVIDVH